MTKGILWVSSRITRPEELSAEKFCEWYENVNIPPIYLLYSTSPFHSLRRKMSKDVNCCRSTSNKSSPSPASPAPYATRLFNRSRMGERGVRRRLGWYVPTLPFPVTNLSLLPSIPATHSSSSSPSRKTLMNID